jgi:hypothetical protein
MATIRFKIDDLTIPSVLCAETETPGTPTGHAARMRDPCQKVGFDPNDVAGQGAHTGFVAGRI